MSGKSPDEPPSDTAPGARPGKRRPTVTTAGAATRTAREARRADALRRNLGRRKTQARARSDDAAEGGTDGVADGSKDASTAEDA